MDALSIRADRAKRIELYDWDLEGFLPARDLELTVLERPECAQKLRSG